MGTWRDRVPERYRDLPEMINTRAICELLGYTPTHVRRMRQAQQRAAAAGTIPRYAALPPARSDLPGPAVVWWTEDIIRWGLETGRIQPVTGKPVHLRSSGRVPNAQRVDRDDVAGKSPSPNYQVEGSACD